MSKLHVNFIERTFLSCMKEAWEKEKMRRKVGFKNVVLGDPDLSDDTCAICADGGHLICCDSCPSTFHQSCLMLETLPDGSWYCPYCICKICRVHGSENMLSCKECGYKYHKDSCWENDMHLMGLVPFSFCGKSCKNVSAELSSILGKKNQTGDGISWTLLKCLDEDEGNISSERLSSIMESNIKLSLALRVLDECFDSLIDRWTGVDMLCQVVYNCGKKLTMNGVHDIHGLRLIVEKEEDCYRALKSVHREWPKVLGEVKDYISRPKYNGYQSLHIVVQSEDSSLLEIQIRTKEMHLQAEYGFAAHWRYKEGDSKYSSFVLQMVEWARWMVTWQCESVHADRPLSFGDADSIRPSCMFPSHSSKCPDFSNSCRC